MANINNLFEEWCQNALADADLKEELLAIKNDSAKINDAFFKELEFGTGGLRGKIGAGTNRMNVYTVARATLGLANFISNTGSGEKKVAIGYDTRIKSKLFAETAAKVLSNKNITVFLFNRPLPTPTLSFAVRELGCNAGIMITASHNPAVYNGYKVYGADGCQITTKAADEIYHEISRLGYFESLPEQAGEKIHEVPEEVYEKFIASVTELSLAENTDKTISVVYTPLNGTGMEPVTDILKRNGYQNIIVVNEQAEHDGNFPTCPFPNPEMPEAMALGLTYAKKHNAEILLATDPDCDRVGVAVKQGNDYQLLTGNEVGILLFDYICRRKTEMGTMPQNPLCVKTIVTTLLAEKIAANYGVEMVNVLTGFKFIGEKIGELEQAGQKERYLFGFEESCGYLSGSHVRDKDGVNAALLICEMCGFYRSLGVSLAEKLAEIYNTYGYSLNSLLSFTFEGEVGMQKMKDFMVSMRRVGDSFGGFNLRNRTDYLAGVDGLPKSDVLAFELNDECSVIIRPSGTEPKLKFYLFANGETKQIAKEKIQTLQQTVEGIVQAS
ncbi:MAG: phospho-sugar mutase [Clostridia bacterium]|nr:phospho-sugar mutase [Clostridia bacterium]